MLHRRLTGAALLLGAGLLAASAAAQPPAALPPPVPPPSADEVPVPPLRVSAPPAPRPVIATSRPVPPEDPSPLPVPSDGLDGLPRAAAADKEPPVLTLPKARPLAVPPARSEAARPTPVRPAAYHPDAEMPPAAKPPEPTSPGVVPPPAAVPPAGTALNCGFASGSTEPPAGPARNPATAADTSLVSVAVVGPAEVAPGEPLAYEIVAHNPGPFAAGSVRLEQTLPAGARFLPSEPPAEAQGDRLAWPLGNLEAGAERRVKVEVQPAAGPEVVVAPTVAYTAPVALRVRVVKPAFAVSVEAPADVMRGGAVPIQLRVANHAGHPVDRVVVTVKLPPGLRHPAGAEVEAEVGTLGAGEERALLPLEAAAAAEGRQVVEAEARADGGLHARSRAEVAVGEAKLAVRLDGPASAPAGRDADLTVEVKNPGIDPAKNPRLTVTVPEGLEVLGATDGGVFHRVDRTLDWRLDALAGGRTQRVVVRVRPHQPGEWAAHAAAAADGMAAAKATHAIKVEAAARPGTPLRVEVLNPHGTVEVGGEATYEVRVHNPGRETHADVRLGAELPAGLALVEAAGPVRHRVLEPERPAGGGFPPPPPGVEFDPLPELRPREVAVYRVRVRCRQAGTYRVRFPLSADGQPLPAAAEAGTRVTDAARAEASGPRGGAVMAPRGIVNFSKRFGCGRGNGRVWLGLLNRCLTHRSDGRRSAGKAVHRGKDSPTFPPPAPATTNPQPFPVSSFAAGMSRHARPVGGGVLILSRAGGVATLRPRWWGLAGTTRPLPAAPTPGHSRRSSGHSERDGRHRGGVANPRGGSARAVARGGEESSMSANRAEKEQLRVHIRWMIRRDMPEVLQTEQESFEFSWSEEDFLRCLRQRNCIGMVAEQGEKVVGFMIYELHKAKLHILNFAVHPQCRRAGVGAQMVTKLISKLSSHRRTRITLEVRETNLSAQLFFRAQTFRAVRVLRGFYEDSGEDAFLMQYKLSDDAGDDAEEAVNRIAQYEES